MGARHRRTAPALWAAILLSAYEARSLAEPVPVLALADEGTVSLEDPGAVSSVRRAAEALGSDALAGPALSTALTERYASPAPQGDPLASARERSRTTRRAWAQAAEQGSEPAQQRALAELEQSIAQLEAGGAALDASLESRRTLEAALLFLSERYEAAGQHALAEEAMRRLARVDPAVAFSATGASPVVQQFYARAVASMLRGSLSVETATPGCTVVRDGRDAGTAPVELQDLPAGRHRVSVRCGALVSLTHTVTIAPRTRATLALDARRDTSLSLGASPGLRYETPAIASARLPADLGALGRSLGARRVVAVEPRSQRARVVDAANGVLVGEAPLTDPAALRALLRAPVPEAPSTSGLRTPPEVTERVIPGRFPVGAPVLWGVGLLLGGAGVYGYQHATALYNGSQQTDDPEANARRGEQVPYWRYGSYAAWGLGGAFVVGGVFLAIFGRTPARTERVLVSPTASLGSYGVSISTGF